MSMGMSAGKVLFLEFLRGHDDYENWAYVSESGERAQRVWMMNSVSGLLLGLLRGRVYIGRL